MEHLKSELDSLRSELAQMFSLVHSQLERAEKAFLDGDQALVKEIASAEKLVNAKELQIDSRCETILALFTPVAIDLRFVLSALKINTNLERVADIADNISRTVMHSKLNFDKELLELLRMKEAFDGALNMFGCVEQAFEKDDTMLARDVFAKDKTIDLIMKNSTSVAEQYAHGAADKLVQAIPLLSIMKMIERAGDHTKNIAEEIIFYAEARVLKHMGKTSES